MRVTMDSVWERTSEVVTGRAGILAPIAAATIWLPVVIEQAIVGAATGGQPPVGAAAGLVAVLTILVAICGYWGRLALVAVASDPAVTARDALRAAARRLPLLLGLLAIAALVVAALLIPVGVAIGPYATQLSATESTEMSASLSTMPPALVAFVSLYLVAAAIALLWVVIRLLAVTPIVFLERRGVASFRRSFEVTRGHFWRLTGVFLLFLIVVLVATVAARSVTGIAARLIAGPEHPAIVAFVAALFVTGVVAAASVTAAVFVARFYLLRVEAGPPR